MGTSGDGVSGRVLSSGNSGRSPSCTFQPVRLPLLSEYHVCEVQEVPVSPSALIRQGISGTTTPGEMGLGNSCARAVSIVPGRSQQAHCGTAQASKGSQSSVGGFSTHDFKQVDAKQGSKVVRCVQQRRTVHFQPLQVPSHLHDLSRGPPSSQVSTGGQANRQNLTTYKGECGVPPEMGPLHPPTPLPSVGGVVERRLRSSLPTQHDSQRVMDFRTWKSSKAICPSKLHQCTRPHTSAASELGTGAVGRPSSSSQLGAICKCGGVNPQVPFSRNAANHRSQPTQGLISERLRSRSPLQVSNSRGGTVYDVPKLLHGDSRYKTCVQAYRHPPRGLGPAEFSSGRPVLPRSLSLLWSQNCARSIHSVFPSSSSDYEKSRIPQCNGLPRRVFCHRQLDSSVENLLPSDLCASSTGVLYPLGQGPSASEGKKVSGVHVRFSSDDCIRTTRQDGRRTQPDHTGFVFSLATDQSLATPHRQAELHGQGHLRRSHVPAKSYRSSSSTRQVSQQRVPSHKGSSSRSTLVAPIHGAVEWESINSRWTEDLGQPTNLRCIRQSSGGSVSPRGHLSSLKSTTNQVAHKCEGTVRLPCRDTRVGFHLPKETPQVHPTFRCPARQCDSSNMDQQRFVKEQTGNENPERVILALRNSGFSSNLLPHSRQEKCDSGRRVTFRISPNSTAVSSQTSTVSVGSRGSLDREAQFFLAHSLPSSSKQGKISQMRSFVRFAFVMGIQPWFPSELSLIQYACFLARTLPFPSIKGYLDAIRVLHHRFGFQFEWSASTCPKLHLVLSGISSKGLPSKHRQKQAFGASHLLSLRSFCYKFGLHSKQRAAWAAIIVCFWGCLRSDNVVPKSPRLFDPRRHLCVNNLVKIPEGLLCTLEITKTRSAHSQSLKVLLPNLDSLVDLCPVRAITFLLATCASVDGPLFVYHKSGYVVPLLYEDLRDVIRNWALAAGLDPRCFGSHSARRGGATTAYRGGVTDVGIMKLGDWLSNTFLSYVKQDVVDLWDIQMRMLAQLTKEIT